MTPRASFVIPAYNAQSWIAETIKSCLDQTVKQIEIIVVNDGSTDGTAETIDWYAKNDKRVIPFHLNKNVGRSEARNIGNDMAMGEFILVLDADDKAIRKRVQDTLECFKEHNPDLVYGGFITIDTLGNMERRFYPEPFSKETSLKHKTHFICHSTVAYRKGVTRNVRYQGGEFSDLGIDDWRFIWDAHQAGYKFKHIRTPLTYYRRVAGTISGTRDEAKVAEVKDKFLATIQ